MKHYITEDDKTTALSTMQYKYRLYVLEQSERVIDELHDFTLSELTVQGDSSVRRSFSVTINKRDNIVDYINGSLRFKFKLQIGVYNLRIDNFIWYDFGVFVITEGSTTFDMSTNSVTFSLQDKYAMLDGTRNGQNGGAPTISIPNKDANGNYVTISGTLINFLKSEGVTNYIVDDIGEFYGMPANNSNYATYRNNNPLWNKLPYDLEFNAGCTDADIIQEIIEIYPNVQAYYDCYGTFCADMIPSCNNSQIEIQNDYFQKILLADDSENVTYDISSIKNVTEVFGKIYDIDRYSEQCTMFGNVYNITISNFGAYTSYQYIAFTSSGNNVGDMYININGLGNLPLYNEYTTNFVSANTILNGDMCVIRTIRIADGSYVAYYLGKYQPHAICVLTDDVNDKTYTKDYFKNKYNCDHVVLRQETGSPFSVQKIGEVLDVKSGDEYDNIISDSVAEQNAIYQNQISSSMNEMITIKTKLIPWLDVQIKVNYKKAQDNNIESYIVQSISHDVEASTTSISMKKFYPLYYV